jgi:Flp pilus assembly pilin Flp
MKNVLRKFWNDEAGFVVSVELVLISTILVIGLVTGWTMLRDAVISELSDTAKAVGSTNQSFAYSGATYGAAGVGASSAGGQFADSFDLWDTDAASAGVSLAAPTVGLAVTTATDQSATPEGI